MTNIDWERVAKGVARENKKMIWRPYGIPTVMDLEHSCYHDAPISEPWTDIPEQMIISVAITGAFFRQDQNPHQPITPDEIRESAREVALAGASAIHIHVRDEDGYNVLSPERFEAVIQPLHDEFPDVPVDACLVPALDGEWDKMNDVLESGLLDAAPINTTATYIGDSLFVKPTPILLEKTRRILEAGSVPEIAVYTDADVSNADRYLFKSGLLKSGAVWLVLPALPGCSPMENPRQMVASLTRTVEAIRDVDPEAVIMVCAAGRASTYLATLAAVMGLHIRVGMEDTYFKWPHREDKLTSNLEAFQLAKQLAEVVGRRVATPSETRAIMGLKPRVEATATH
ncbi:3-keto-5-aminohexanoate cleavage protein [Paenarthrobacter aromaticivorans]|uniref:3-keto-5-aminohexanoate cleavage protein n=1 Tax=Paenarthrobacter aromaticivorans TaxID=2849150 RepID=A0ABS6I9P5_9MICC|nr:3-keto-5-aminohexanoate cleavage protein [Paenarthrobacter sp. MMS21-TAE1-1]MBU8867804.1 3-keto-5-aminohexanoate cleavage protein [Paenarthrobacter sp. MMS21-TAE1-1]